MSLTRGWERSLAPPCQVTIFLQEVAVDDKPSPQNHATQESSSEFSTFICSGICAAKRFRNEHDEQECRMGCPEQLDCIRHYNVCLRLFLVLRVLLA